MEKVSSGSNRLGFEREQFLMKMVTANLGEPIGVESTKPVSVSEQRFKCSGERLPGGFFSLTWTGLEANFCK